MSTGDVGHFDDDGRLFVDGRDDEMIVSGGENVFPREVEDLLADHEQIDEAAVIGVADEEFGQRLKAFVVRAGDGASLDEEAIKDYVKRNLARFKVPREVVFVDELPRNATGKVAQARAGLSRVFSPTGAGASLKRMAQLASNSISRRCASARRGPPAGAGRPGRAGSCWAASATRRARNGSR